MFRPPRVFLLSGQVSNEPSVDKMMCCSTYSQLAAASNEAAHCRPKTCRSLERYEIHVDSQTGLSPSISWVHYSFLGSPALGSRRIMISSTIPRSLASSADRYLSRSIMSSTSLMSYFGVWRPGKAALRWWR